LFFQLLNDAPSSGRESRLAIAARFIGPSGAAVTADIKAAVIDSGYNREAERRIATLLHLRAGDTPATTRLRLRLIRSLSAFLLAKEDQVNENA
jgi:hypothetical protein